jgi:hypothetical protein
MILLTKKLNRASENMDAELLRQVPARTGLPAGQLLMTDGYSHFKAEELVLGAPVARYDNVLITQRAS